MASTWSCLSRRKNPARRAARCSVPVHDGSISSLVNCAPQLLADLKTNS